MIQLPDTLARRYPLIEARGSHAGRQEFLVQTAGGNPAVLAIEFAPARDRDAYLDRFRREATAARALRAPSIASLLDAGILEGPGVEAACQGATYRLREVVGGVGFEALAATRPLPQVSLVVELVRQIALALHRLHAAGLLVRALAPPSLRIVRSPHGSPRAVLLELGVGGREDEATSRGGVHIAALRYGAPERFESTPRVVPASDLYALGVLAYELLTGRCPVVGDSPSSLLAGHLFRPPVPIAESDPGGRIGEPLRQVILGMLEKDPESRPADGVAVAKALEAAADALPAIDLRAFEAWYSAALERYARSSAQARVEPTALEVDLADAPVSSPRPVAPPIESSPSPPAGPTARATSSEGVVPTAESAEILERILRVIEEAIDAGELEVARDQLERLRQIVGDLEVVREMEQRLDEIDAIAVRRSNTAALAAQQARSTSIGGGSVTLPMGAIDAARARAASRPAPASSAVPAPRPSPVLPAPPPPSPASLSRLDLGGAVQAAHQSVDLPLGFGGAPADEAPASPVSNSPVSDSPVSYSPVPDNPGPAPPARSPLRWVVILGVLAVIFAASFFFASRSTGPRVESGVDGEPSVRVGTGGDASPSAGGAPGLVAEDVVSPVAPTREGARTSSDEIGVGLGDERGADFREALADRAAVRLDIVPWAEIETVRDAAGRDLELARAVRGATTPVLLGVPPGEVHIALRHPPSGARRVVVVEAQAGRRTTARAILRAVSPGELLASLGVGVAGSSDLRALARVYLDGDWQRAATWSRAPAIGEEAATWALRAAAASALASQGDRGAERRARDYAASALAAGTDLEISSELFPPSVVTLFARQRARR